MSASAEIKMGTPILGEEERELVAKCMEEGWISSQGRFVGEFEQAFARYVGAEQAVAVCNGTAALSLAMMALGLAPGDEVIVPSLTFGATANAVLLAGGTPRFVTSDPVYWQMDPDDVARSITPRTKGIIPVHLYGHPVDLDVIRETAEANALWIIEDAAEAHGALYRGRRVGALGQVGCFSFYPNKIITTGEGGMCVTSDPQLAEQMRRGRDHGMSKDRPYWHEQVGANYRMTNLQAAIGLAQLEKVDRFIRAKRRIAALYQELLGSPPELGLHLSAEAPWAFSVYWMNNVILPLGVDRDEVMRSLARSRIESRPFFHPLHSMPAFRSCPRSDAVVSVEEFPLRGISLPSGADLDERRVERVASVLTAAVQRQRSGVRRPT